MGTLADLEARVAALEASHADYRAVLAAVNALGANQREHALGLSELRSEVTTLKTEVSILKTEVSALKMDVAAVKIDVAGIKIDLSDFRQESRAVARSTDEQLAEIRDLIVHLKR